MWEWCFVAESDSLVESIFLVAFLILHASYTCPYTVPSWASV